MLPRAVVVTRPSEYTEAIRAFQTHGQATFHLQRRGRDIDELQARHGLQERALTTVLGAIPGRWRRATLTRADLPAFTFEPDDVVLAVGQDGLVANVARFLTGQPVIGVNPDPSQVAGVLVQHSPEGAARLLATLEPAQLTVERRTMVQAALSDGQTLLALNEIFVGHRSHQSARYLLEVGGASERQSSSGLIVSTGTGATGWARSLHRERRSSVHLPKPTDPSLAFFVREAWPSPTTGTKLTEGLLADGEALGFTNELNEGGVVFGDGIEQDFLALSWAQRVEIRRAPRALALVPGAPGKRRRGAGT
ncbi:MAG: hypothetical protein ABIO70_12035 [Pseudomonadota bacterium]